MNKIIISGNLIKEPQISMSKAGKAICNITIAVKQDFKTDGEYKSDFFNCVAFGFSADYIGNYLTKGSKVLIVGKLQNNNYEKDGVKHYGDKIVIENIEGLDKKKQSSEMESFGQPMSDEDISQIPF